MTPEWTQAWATEPGGYPLNRVDDVVREPASRQVWRCGCECVGATVHAVAVRIASRPVTARAVLRWCGPSTATAPWCGNPVVTGR